MLETRSPKLSGATLLERQPGEEPCAAKKGSLLFHQTATPFFEEIDRSSMMTKGPGTQRKRCSCIHSPQLFIQCAFQALAVILLALFRLMLPYGSTEQPIIVRPQLTVVPLGHAKKAPDIQHLAAAYDAMAVVFRTQNPYRTWLFARALQSPGLFHAAMAFCEASIQCSSPSPDLTVVQRLNYHRGRALVYVKDKLKEHDKHYVNAICETILTLGNVEVRQTSHYQSRMLSCC